jgi:hypothetical protein
VILSYLMCNIGSSVTDISIHLAHDADVFVGIEQRVLVVFHAIATAVCSLVCLKTCVGQNDNETLGVFISRRDWCHLLGDEVRQCRWRQRLCVSSCHARIEQLVSHDCKDLVERRDAKLMR